MLDEIGDKAWYRGVGGLELIEVNDEYTRGDLVTIKYRLTMRTANTRKEYKPPPPPDNSEELRERMEETEARIERLETALAAVVRALAYGGASYPYPNTTPLHKHGLCGSETARYLAAAAEALGIDVGLE